MRATFRYFLTLLCDALEDVFKVFMVFLKTFALTLYFAMSQNGQTHFKNLAAFAGRFLKCV